MLMRMNKKGVFFIFFLGFQDGWKMGGEALEMIHFLFASDTLIFCDANLFYFILFCFVLFFFL